MGSDETGRESGRVILPPRPPDFESRVGRLFSVDFNPRRALKGKKFVCRVEFAGASMVYTRIDEYWLWGRDGSWDLWNYDADLDDVEAPAQRWSILASAKWPGRDHRIVAIHLLKDVWSADKGEGYASGLAAIWKEGLLKNPEIHAIEAMVWSDVSRGD